MKRTRSPQHTKAVLMLLLANLLWGLSFPTIKALAFMQESLAPGGSTWFYATLTIAPRFLLTTLILALFQIRTLGGTTAKEIRQGLLLGGFTGVGMLLQNDGLQFTEASTSAFLTQLYAILIPLWFAATHRRNPGNRIWVCCLLVLVGVAILGHFDIHSLSFGRGELETLLSSLFFMGQILLLDRSEFAGNRPERITLIMAATQGTLFAVMSCFLAPNTAALLTPWTSLPWFTLTLALTLFCTIGAFTLMNAWQPKITPTEAGLIYCFEPIFGSLMALCLPAVYSAFAGIAYANETVTWNLLVGGVLITLANVLLQMRPPQKSEA